MNAQRRIPFLDSFRENRTFLYGSAALSILVVVISALIALTVLRRDAETQATAAAQNIVRSLDHTIEGAIDTIDVALLASADEITRDMRRGTLDRQAVTDLLIRQQKRLPLVNNIRASNEWGEAIYGPGAFSPAVNITDREYFLRLRDDPTQSLFISKPVVGRHLQKWIWLFARRINKPDGSFGGVIFASVLIDEIERLMTRMPFDAGGVATLRDADLAMIARHTFGTMNPIPYGDRKISSPFEEALRVDPNQGTYVSGDTSIDGISRAQSYRRNPKYGYVVNAGISGEAANAHWRRHAAIVVGLVSLFVLASVALAWQISLAWRRREQDMATIVEAESRFRAVLDASPIPFALNDIEDRVTYLNPAFVRAFGYTIEDIPTLAEWWPKAYPDAEYRQWVARTWAASMELAQSSNALVEPLEVNVRCKGGAERTVLIGAAPIGNTAHGSHLITFYDFTERKVAEQQLRKLSLAVEQSPESIMITNLAAEIEYVNEAFVANTGYSREEVLGGNPRILHSGRTPRETFAGLWETLMRGEPWTGEFHNKRKDGSEYIEHAVITPIRQSGGRVTHYVAVKEDITSRKGLEQTLQQRNSELRELYASLQTVREDERQRFARELHDDLGQRVTALRMDLDWLDANRQTRNSRIPIKQATISVQVDELADAIRRITEDLRPGMLDILGLSAAIENYAQNFSQRTGIRCELAVSHDDVDVEGKVAIGIFRIVQEALNNVSKHASASRVEVVLDYRDGEVVLVIHDNGQGMREISSDGRAGFGLLGMRERVSILNGRIAIDSKAGKGVRIEVAIPA